MNIKNMEHFYQTIGEDFFTYPNLYAQIVAAAPQVAHFVEIGCWKGRSASFMGVEIHNSGKQIKFDCIDHWDVEGGLDLFKENTKSLSHIITPIFSDSVKGADLYEDESLDFVFIDAGHLTHEVLADMNAWYPKVKSGGIFAGHDYFPGSWDSVVTAVHEWMGDRKFEVSEGCWIYQKP
jgi:predicted O-methyltransferase YrrM